ncbi:phosphoheptose isomerase [Balneicella halophila]|uniref:Phosphoheptose isomerase n=1 Tax=Balneicella halophila TaxID=1537566 RepID=A0A7L4UTC7_BALHA|nr:D-sedoheptulose 7-phosphate isomerase [Balneicella halophila]PVX52354.1 phosphoheptose isomerase [Balneicella halophila]
MDIKYNFEEAQSVLQAFMSDAKQIGNIQKAGDLMVTSIANKGKIISCGNGGSMCDAMHFAEELTGRFRDDRKALPAIAISDPSHISCVGNDYGFESVFSRYIEAIGREADVLLAISTSGNSANVIKATEVAKNIGMKVVGLTGKDGGRLAPLCDVEIRVPWNGYADRIQEIHIKIIHTLIQYIEKYN